MVARFGGSWTFIIAFFGFLVLWAAVNTHFVLADPPDPYPFILLNLVLSFQAAYAAPIIMMSQNRQAAKDRLQADFDLETNLKAETLIEELHGSMETLRITQWSELLQLQQSQIGMLRELVRAPREGCRQDRGRAGG